MAVFVVSGLWHGANWTFVTWGALNALFIMPTVFFQLRGKQTDQVCDGRLCPTLLEAVQMGITFAAICVTWILFRSETLSDALAYFIRMVEQCTTYPGGILVAFRYFRFEPAVLLVLTLLCCEWISRWRSFRFDALPRPARWCLYQATFLSVIWFTLYREPTRFIYFQF